MSEMNINLPPYRGNYEEYNTGLGIGILGYGRIVQRLHMPAYKLAGYNVVAACDKSEASLVAAKAAGISKTYDDFVEMINDDEVDIIDCTIHHDAPFDQLRLEVVKACAKAGKSILMAKPLAINLELAEEMTKIAEDAGINLAVNQQSRFNPVPYAIKGLLTPEYLGQAGVIEIANIQRCGDRLPFGDQIADINFPIHHCDLVRWWADSKPVSVYSTMGNNSAIAVYEFENGVRAEHKEVTGPSIENSTPISVWAEKGSLRAATQWNMWCNWSKEFLDVRFADASHAIKNISYMLPGEPYNPYWADAPPWDVMGPDAGFVGIMADLMNATANKTTPSTNARDNILSVKMWLAAQKSAEEKRVVLIDEL